MIIMTSAGSKMGAYLTLTSIFGKDLNSILDSLKVRRFGACDLGVNLMFT